MKKLVTAQLVLGLALLFGSSYGALQAYLGPTLDSEAESRAMLGARVVASETLIAWNDLLASRRTAVTALAQTPILRTVAADAKESERSAVIKAALDGALRGTGGIGSVGLYDSKGAPVIPGLEPALGRLDATKAALEGVPNVRVETVDGVLQLVSAAPAGAHGALVMALPLDTALLGRVRTGLPQGAHAALIRSGQAGSSTFPTGAALGDLAGDRADVGGASYRLARRALVDDAGAELTVVGLAPVYLESQAPIAGHLSLGLLVMSGAALVLVLLVTALGGKADSDEDEELLPNTLDLALRDDPIREPSVLSPAPALKLKFDASPPAQLIRDAKPIDFPSAPTPEPQPSLYVQKTLPSHPSPAPAPMPSMSSNLPSWASSAGGPSTPPPPSAPPAPPPWSDPASPSLFDAIASAAITSPPPAAAPKPAIAPMSFGGEDLPVPKEGFSPEVMAAQKAVAQRAAHGAPTQAPTMAPNFASNPYDADLPMPKGPMGVAPFTPRPSGPVFQNPVKASPVVPVAPAQSSAIPLAPSKPRAPSIPPTALVAPSLAPRPSSIPGVSQSKAIPLPGRSLSSPGREAPPRSTSTPGDLSFSSLPMAAGAPSSMLPNTADPQPFDEEHYRFVYNEFVSSKAKLGEAVENITYEGFRTKLRSSEQALLDRHGCRAVRFQVLVKDKTVSLRPQLVR